MGIEILIETQKIEDRVTSMIEKISVLPVPQEFIAWQSDDMNRSRPSAEATSSRSMYTMIYPRARRRAVWRRRARAKPAKPRRLGRAYSVAGRSFGKRPILRPELFERLCERMRALLGGVKW